MESFTKIKNKERKKHIGVGVGNEGDISLVSDLVYELSLIYSRDVPT